MTPSAPRLRIYCVPFATGSASVYSDWSRWFPPSVSVRPLEYPGHGRRFGQRPVASITQIARIFASEIASGLDGPFAFFGHSMGALVAFELTRELRQRRAPLPVKFYVSASPPPVSFRAPRRGPDVPALSDAQLRDRLRHLGGTPTEMLENDELMQLMLPIARADLAACEQYVYRPDAPLPCPITAVGGVDDRTFDPSHLARWRETTRSVFDTVWMPGGHFFLRTHSQQLLTWLRDDIRGLLGAGF